MNQSTAETREAQRKERLRSEMIRRLQIAALGMALVLAISTVAGLTIRQASDETPVTEGLPEPTFDGNDSMLEEEPEVKDEPLEDLGVQPEVEEKAQPSDNAKQAP